MAIIFEGNSACGLCNETINEGDDLVAFPPIFFNEKSPLFSFNDSAFHASCIENDQNGKIAFSLLRDWTGRTGPGKRFCDVCGEEILNPDDYLIVELLSTNKENPLFEYNWKHFHKSCLSDWKNREELIELLVREKQSGEWGGEYLDHLLGELVND